MKDKDILNAFKMITDEKYFELYFAYYDKDKQNNDKIDDKSVENLKTVKIPPNMLVKVVKGLIYSGLYYEKEYKEDIGLSEIIAKEDE